MKGESEVVLSRGDDDRRVLPGQIAGWSSVVRESSSPANRADPAVACPRFWFWVPNSIPATIYAFPCFFSAPNPPLRPPKMSTPAATAESKAGAASSPAPPPPSAALPLEGPLVDRPATQSTGDAPSPSAMDYKSIISEDEFHKLADETVQELLEKLEWAF